MKNGVTNVWENPRERCEGVEVTVGRMREGGNKGEEGKREWMGRGREGRRREAREGLPATCQISNPFMQMLVVGLASRAEPWAMTQVPAQARSLSPSLNLAEQISCITINIHFIISMHNIPLIKYARV